MSNVLVTLTGKDGVTHAQGYVAFGDIANAQVVLRKGVAYIYKPNIAASIDIEFVEATAAPYIITEF